MIRAIFVTTITFAYVLIVGPPLLLFTLLTGNSDPIYAASCAGGRLALWLGGVKVLVEGRENLAGDGAVVFMSNHQSNCDPPAIFSVLPPVLVLGKKEFFRVPVLGAAMRMRGFIPVDRKDHDQARLAVERAAAALKAGKSFLVYPEGTRSPDGRLQGFKKGVFFMAIEAGAPIVPVSISGAHLVMRKGEMAIRPGSVRLRFHRAIPTRDQKAEGCDELVAKVRRAIASGLAPDEQPLEGV